MIDTVDQIWAMKETTGVEAIIEVEVEVEKVSHMLEIFLILFMDILFRFQFRSIVFLTTVILFL